MYRKLLTVPGVLNCNKTNGLTYTTQQQYTKHELIIDSNQIRPQDNTLLAQNRHKQNETQPLTVV